MIALHMGALHPFEQVMTLVLAFGPFLLLGAVIVHRRRQEDAHAADSPAEPGVEPQRDR